MDETIKNALELFDETSVAKEQPPSRDNEEEEKINLLRVTCDMKRNNYQAESDDTSISDVHLKPPHPDFQGRIVYMTMGGYTYIPELEMFITTMLNFGISIQDIGIVCIDKEAAIHMHENYDGIQVYEYVDQIENTKCQKNEAISDVRCRVSLGKANAIIDFLSRGDAVYFVDADVFFYQHPYESMRTRGTYADLYVQVLQCTVAFYFSFRQILGIILNFVFFILFIWHGLLLYELFLRYYIYLIYDHMCRQTTQNTEVPLILVYFLHIQQRQ